MSIRLSCILLVCCFQCPMVLAQPSTQYEMNDLLIDHTYTLSGKIFYRQFAKHWFLHGSVTKANLVVTENNTMGSASVLSVFVNRTKVFEFKTTPTNIYKNAAWKYAVVRVSNHLKDNELNNLLVRVKK